MILQNLDGIHSKIHKLKLQLIFAMQCVFFLSVYFFISNNLYVLVQMSVWCM